MRVASSVILALCGTMAAQTATLRPIDFFTMKEDGLAIRQHVEGGKPFTVAGARGVILGQQEGYV